VSSAAQPMPPRCGCDQSKFLAERVRTAGVALEHSLVLLGSPNLSEQEKVVLVAKLLGLARNMKECPL
jgi:hypothetical protein